MPRERQIILDTETTGLYPDRGDRILEFAGIEMNKRQLTDRTLHLYIHPDRDIPEEAAAVHGLTLDVLAEKNAPKFAAVGQEIADFLRGAELIIHNARFDVGFLDMEFARMGLPSIEELGCEVTDTLAMAREKYPGQKASLDALCNRLDIDRSKRVYHGALIDCELLAEVYLAMTREQFDLVGGGDTDAETQTQTVQASAPPVRTGRLKVIQADADELAAHAAILGELNQASGGRCLWQPEAREAAE
ncbi:DNA polymerase III subunit epsilon [Kingella potus]|uniref:DNA polymerase III subunit epsilon n=1 Tax=Kingella potus TaxID=265175 RepID=A0A377QZM0_9NEIS|nr:DNA polymerase III subunit epsilon [Kingella potus]UOP01027.1 DNA polymerase III subunit epsilon [Kingella potus]STR00703.1 DNA polymerase III subunit epsilon [Kingella potus]